jgi:hypothetical protein
MDKFQQWSETRFEGLDKDKLIEAGKEIGLDFPRQMKEETMRTKLNQTLGHFDNEPAAKPAPKSAPLRANGDFDPKPQLKSVDGWGGKKWRVRVYAPSPDSDNPQKYFQVKWENETRAYEYNKDVILCHPLYESLKNAVKRRVVQQQIRDENNIVIDVRNTQIDEPRYHFDTMGNLPGTEGLPTSEIDYWRTQARKTNNFEGQRRRVLQQIRADLYGPAGPAFYKDLTDQDILYDVLIFLWGDSLLPPEEE